MNKGNDCDEILEKIKNEPTNASNYDLLSKILCENQSKVMLNGKQVGELDLYLIMVDLEPSYKNAHYSIYAYLTEETDNEEITLLSGETLSLNELLVREISYNHNSSFDAYITLGSRMESLEESIDIPFYNNGNSGDGDLIQSFGTIDLFGTVLYLDPDYEPSYQLLSEIMNKYNIDSITLQDGSVLFKKDIYYRFYKYYKDIDPMCYYLIGSLLKRNISLQLDDGTLLNKQDILIDGINKFPNELVLYYNLANHLTNNYQIIQINQNGKQIEMNRIELLNFILSNTTSTSSVHLYHHKLGLFLEDNEDKINQFIKSLEIKFNFNDCKIDLFKCMSINQKVIINGISYTRLQLIQTIDTASLNWLDQTNTITVNQLLIYHFTEIKDKSQIDNYNSKLVLEKENYKSYLIQEINNDPTNTSYYHYYKLSLELYFDKDEIYEDDYVEIGQTKMNKIDLLLHSINIKPDLDYAYLELSKCLKDESNLKLLNGELKNKNEIMVMEKCKDSNYFYQISKYTNSITDKINHLKNCISLNPNYVKAYLEIGIILRDNDIINNSTISILNTEFSRKQLFIHAINNKQYLEDTYDDIYNQTLSYYYLSLEMTIEEIQFGKNKKEILSEIIKNYPQFSKAHIDLSNL